MTYTALAPLSSSTPQFGLKSTELASYPHTSMEDTFTMPFIDPKLEHTMTNGITVYGSHEVTFKIASVMNEFPEIWTDQGTTVNISESKWMPIPLKSNSSSKSARMYLVSEKNRKVIDETFDKMHEQGKMN